MSSVDLSDPHITTAHDALLHNDPLRWFLLAYSNRPNVLILSASGTGDIDELRTHLTDNVCYAVFREQTQNKFLHVLLNYIPDSVKGVWRARALVHGKAVSSKFKVHQVMTVSKPDQVTVQALRFILRLPPRVLQLSSFTLSPPSGSDEHPKIASIVRKAAPHIRSVSVSSSPARTGSPSPTNNSHSRPSSPFLAPSLSTEKQAPPTAVDIPSPPTGNGSSPVISSARHTTSLIPLAKIATADLSKSVTNSSQYQSPVVASPLLIQSTHASRVPHTPLSPENASWLAKQDAPLPPPPPSEIEEERQDADRSSVNSDERPLSAHIGSIPDTNSVASLHTSDRAPSPVPAPAPSILPDSTDSGLPTRHIEEKPSRAIDGLPATSLSSPPAASQEINDNSVTTRTSAGSSASARLRSKFQERASLPADTEEERKLVVLEEERRRRAAERARREKEEREEEEARKREFEERKEREKKRRLETARRAEEQRAELRRQQAEEEARQKAEKEQKEAELRERRSHIKQRFEKRAGMDLLSGFITLESSSSWKRRYYRLSTEDWIFFKNDEDTTTPMHALELSRVQALREWNEGYEELEAIPNSFAVELKDDAPWLFFADSSEDKEILLGLLNQAAGL